MEGFQFSPHHYTLRISLFSHWQNRKAFSVKGFQFSPHHWMLRIFSASGWIKRILAFTTPLDVENIFSASGGIKGFQHEQISAFTTPLDVENLSFLQLAE